MQIIIVRHLRNSNIERICNFIFDLSSDFEGDHIDKLKQYREPAACEFFGSGKYNLLPTVSVKPREHHKAPKIIKAHFGKIPKATDFNGQGNGQHGL